MHMLKNELFDKFAGVAYGAAIGDALGATTEFMTVSGIRHCYPNGVRDLIGGGAFGWKPGEVTDDTQMALCVARAVMATYDVNGNSEFFAAKCAAEFVKWYDSDPKDIGATCAAGIRQIKIHGLVSDENREITQSEGNGGLMRAWPLAMIGNFYLNQIQNNLTHMNPVCIDALVDFTRAMLAYFELDDRTLLSLRPSHLMQPTGHVIATLNNALYYTINSWNFESAVCSAANAGGDSDTIASVTGALSGARFGFGSIPKRWIQQLDPDVKQELDQYVSWVCKHVEICGNMI